MPTHINVLCYCTLEDQPGPARAISVTFNISQEELASLSPDRDVYMEDVQRMLRKVAHPSLGISVVSMAGPAGLLMYEDIQSFDEEIEFRKGCRAILEDGVFDLSAAISSTFSLALRTNCGKLAKAHLASLLVLATIGERDHELTICLLEFIDRYMTPAYPSYNLAELPFSLDKPCVEVGNELGWDGAVAAEGLMLHLGKVFSTL